MLAWKNWTKCREWATSTSVTNFESLTTWCRGGRNLDFAVILWRPLVRREINIWVSHEAGNFLTIWENIAFSSNALLYWLRNICTSVSWWGLQTPHTLFPLTVSLLTLTSSYLLLSDTYRPASVADKAGPTGNPQTRIPQTLNSYLSRNRLF